MLMKLDYRTPQSVRSSVREDAVTSLILGVLAIAWTALYWLVVIFFPGLWTQLLLLVVLLHLVNLLIATCGLVCAYDGLRSGKRLRVAIAGLILNTVAMIPYLRIIYLMIT